MLKQKKIYGSFIIGVFILIGCTSLVTPTLTKDPSVLPGQEEGTTQQSPMTYTSQPVATLELFVPTIPSPVSPTMTPSTLVAMPTLTHEQKTNSFTQLMTENSGCELPCWWGIITGVPHERVLTKRDENLSADYAD